MPPILHNAPDDIVRDSIIQNKEKTKSYWEQRMMAASNTNLNNISNNSNRSSICSVESNEDGPNVKEEKRRIERELALSHVSNSPQHYTMQEKIAQELQLMKLREEELRIARSSSMEMKISSHDGSNCSEYGSDESNRGDSLRNRAQSMESVSSGLSSGSGSANTSGVADISLEIPRRKRDVVVRPFDDPEPEQVPVLRIANETPIEREIRLAREREAELRKSWGLEDVKPPQVPQVADDSPKEVVLSPVTDPHLKSNDVLDVQLKIATHRIEREIAEAGERETQLRSLGRILTTSIDTVDSKVTRYADLVDATTQDKARRTRRTVHTASVLDEQPLVSKKFSLPDNRNFAASNSQRGLMQRFIASKGRLQVNGTAVGAAAVATPPPPLFIPSPAPAPIASPPTRNGFMSAEEKIQSELKEMQRREEELRIQRAHRMARSQPNLLDMMDDEDPINDDVDDIDATTPEPRPLRHASLPHFASNPSLALNPKTINSNNTSGRRKRFSLLEEWENRIQNS